MQTRFILWVLEGGSWMIWDVMDPLPEYEREIFKTIQGEARTLEASGRQVRLERLAYKK